MFTNSLEKAISTLNHGIQNNAEPVESLQHLLQATCTTREPIIIEEEKHSAKVRQQGDDATPRAVVALLDMIDFQLAINARRAMLQQCYRYGVETSFEEIRARWPKRNMTRQSTSAASAVTGGALRTGHPNRARRSMITKPSSPYNIQSASHDSSNNKSYTHTAAQHNKRSKLVPQLSSTTTASLLAKRPIILSKKVSVIRSPQVQLPQQPAIKEPYSSNDMKHHQPVPITKEPSSPSTTSREESSITTDVLSKPIEIELPEIPAVDEIFPDGHIQKEVEGAIIEKQQHQVSAKVEPASSPQHQQIIAIPYEAHVVKRFLEQVNDPPVTEYKGYHDMLKLKRKPQLEGEFNLGTIRYTMKRKLGEGGTSSVYELQGSLALKVESVMCNAWEFYIMRQAAQRCKQPSHVVAVHEYYAYRTTTFMVMDLAKHGTLLDALNEHRLKYLTSAMSEARALCIIIELLDALCDLHGAGIIHGDVKMENVVVIESSPSKGDRVAFIDFGRAMDLTLVSSPNIRIYPRWRPVKPGTIDPPISSPWLPWALDYWGLAGIAHWLLFGNQIRVRKVAQQQGSSRWVLREHIKRYWHKTFWDDFFDQLMNPSTAATTSTAPAQLLAAAKRLVT